MGELRKASPIGISSCAGTSPFHVERAALVFWLTLYASFCSSGDMIDPTIAVHRGRVVKRTGDGAIVEFGSLIDAVRCAIEVQSGVVERNAGLPPERRIEFRIGIHLGDVVRATAIQCRQIMESILPRVSKVFARLAGFAYRRHDQLLLFRDMGRSSAPPCVPT